MLKKIRSLFLYIVLPACLIELWVGFYLFEHASYTNSTSLDETIKALRKSNENHEMFFFGDSEVHWGVDPVAFDTRLRSSGIQVRSFNFGIDGFSGAINYELLKKLDVDMFKGIKVALIGVQLIEYHNVYPNELKVRADQGQSDLKRPIFMSPFGIDHSLTTFSEAEKSLLDRSPLRTIRYRKALKSMLLKDSTPIGAGFFSPRSDGFSPHLSIRANPENYALDIKRKKEEKAANQKSFSALDQQRWEQDLEEDEYFDQMATFFLERDIYPVFFALPTNPWYIDFKNRRDSYSRNSKKITEWASRRGMSFIDLGILDSFSPEDDFADFRHLSSSGAAQFSKELAGKIAQLPYVQSICNSGNKNIVRAIRNWNKNRTPENVYSGGELYPLVKDTNELSSMDLAGENLVVASEGNDPWMILNAFKMSKGKRLVGRIEIETDHDTTFSVSWLTDKMKHFNSEMTSNDILSRGKNVIYFMIDDVNTIEKLRIDPGQRPGKYQISSLSYKVF